MTGRSNMLRYGRQLICKRQQRLLSVSANVRRIIKSPLQDVELPSVCLTEYVWKNLDQWPDKVAFECGVTGRQYKYAEARNLCGRFSASLRRAGLQPGNTLAIIMPNTPEWPITFLGAVESGIVVTTVNPTYTAEEIARQLRDCEVQAIVTISSAYPTILEALKLSGKQTKPLIIIAPGTENDFTIPPGTIDFREMIQNDLDTSGIKYTGNVDDTVVMPYSSGTTGLPKGVMLSHRNVVSNCAQLNDRTEICISEPAIGSHQDVAPVILPFFHIYGMSVLLMAKLAHGVKLVTLPKFEPTSFLKMLDNYKATILYVAPPLVLFLASHSGVQTKHLQSLRYLVTGAAPAGRLDIERFLRRAPKTTNVLQAYGMTETSPTISHMPKGSVKYESVGVPIPNTEMIIRHPETGISLQENEIGEVCLRGPQVMKGYFKRPDATSEIIDDKGWLRTGDLGYYDSDNYFYVVDRLKELIKVKGYQVAPAELEEILRSHPGIDDAAVIGVPDERAGEVPKAFVVLKDTNISESDIQKFVADKVSDYKKLKGGVEFMSSIPKTQSGKILRKILRERL